MRRPVHMRRLRLLAALLAVIMAFAIVPQNAVASLRAHAENQADAQSHILSAVCRDLDNTLYRVRAAYSDSTGIPADAALSVQAVPPTDDRYEAYLSQTAALLENMEDAASQPRFFDINLVDKNDSDIHYQPADGTTVEVSIQLEDAPENDLFVVHFAENELPEVLESTTDGDTVSFETTGFSLYALVDAPPPYSVTLETVATLSELQDDPDAGYFLSANKSGRPNYFTGNLNSNDAFLVTMNASQAETWYFEPVPGTQNQFYIYTLVNGEPQYIHQKSANLLELSSQGSAFELTESDNGTFYIKLVGQSRWLQYSNGGVGFRLYTDKNNAENSRITLTYASSIEPPNDPDGLSGKSYGIVRSDSASAIELTDRPHVKNPNTINPVTIPVQLNPLDYENNLLIAEGELTMWTFHSLSGSTYHITAQVNGATKYLRVDDTSATLVDTPDEYCEITVTNGTGNYSGRYKFSTVGGTLTYGKRTVTEIVNGVPKEVNYYCFGGSTTGSGNNIWLKLAVPSDLTLGDLVSYTAEKVSIADNADEVNDGDQVVIYTRIWNETKREYEFYVVNHNGKLVRAYDEGDTIRWEGSSINTMLWDFTEYHYADGTPNYYYELQNTYSGKYLAPQIQDGQILSNSTIGVTLNGRRWNDYYSNIMAWDDAHYDYAAFTVEGTNRIIPVSMAQGMDFYFAKMATLTTADTVDNDDYGIHLRMVKFPVDQVYDSSSTNGGRNRLQTNVIGVGTDYVSGSDLKFPTLGLVTTNLDGDGYPTATRTNRSLEDLFGSATDANHLFLQQVYNESGYFQYDCTQTFATLGQDGNFTVYNQLGTININAPSQGHGQFMPYNDLDPNLISDYTNVTDVHNNELSLNNPRYGEELYSIPLSEAQYHFGMEMEASFVQSPSGLDAWGHDIVFEFAGDDDMWLYVDGELVLDLGGIHSALVGKINFSTGIVTIPTTDHTDTVGNAARLVTKTLREIFEENYRERYPEKTNEEVEAYLNDIFDENSPGRTVFKDYSSHTMKMFYMERGASMSNLHMRFNLTTSTDGQLLLEKTVSGTDKQEYSSVRFPYQIWYYDKDYNDWRTVSRTTVTGEGDEVTYQYTGASSVNYAGTDTPVEYVSRYENRYDDVFFLTPGQVADIRFPDDTTEYYVRECYIDKNVYDTVSANNVVLQGTPVDRVNLPDIEDFETQPEVIGKRKVVNFNNHVDEDSLSNLLITKKLFTPDGQELDYEDDPTGFRFRIYMGSTEPLDYYRLDKYYVKDPDNRYCYYNPATASFASTGVSDFSQLTDAQRQSVTFTTSPSGAIDKIPTGYTVEIRNLLVDTKFRIEERFSDIPKGYNLISYERSQEDTSYNSAAGDTENSGTIRGSETPHVIVNNQRGWGLTAVKSWSDRDFMQSHDNIYIAVYNSHEYPVIDSNAWPIAGTVRVYTASTDSLYYYFDHLETGASFSDYVVREVLLTDPVVDENGYVTSYTSITPVDPSGTLPSGGIPNDSNTHVDYNYIASYTVGQPTGVNLNVRTDTVTNARPEGIRMVKTDWLGNPLPNAVFTLEDENNNPVGRPSFTTGTDGLITTAYLDEDTPYTLTEVRPPYQYVALMDDVVITKSSTDGTVTATGAPQGVVRVEPNDPSGMVTVYVKNRQTALLVKKVDAADHTVGLSNAHFALYPQVMGVNGPRKDYFPIEGLEDLVSDDNGILVGFPEWLPAGTYYLVETAAPSGYTPLSEDILFTVEESGEITVHNTSMQSWLEPVDDATTGVRTYVFSIENSGTKSIALVKTNMDGTLYLSGAQFELYHKNDFDDATNTPRPNATLLASGVTDANGVLSLGDLPIGEYRLVETVAPFTYICLTEPVKLFVYQHSVEVLQDSTYTTATVQQNGTYLVPVRNHQGYELPSVGGVGILPFYTAGALLVVGSVVLLLRRRRKKEIGAAV